MESDQQPFRSADCRLEADPREDPETGEERLDATDDALGDHVEPR